MGRTKDQWTRPERGPDGKINKDARGKVVRVRNDRWGKGKRWLACWTDLNGVEKSRAFKTQAAADRHWKAMETDKERGEYIDPNAGQVLLCELGKRWLASRVVDPSSQLRYESVYRLHVEPKFGHHQIKSIKPSTIQAWIGELSNRFDASTVLAAFLVLQGVLELAVADDAVKKNPAKSQIVQVPKRQGTNIVAWSDDRVLDMIQAHPEQYRLLPVIGAACGLREGELFGLAEEDIDFDQMIIRVRRQIKNINGKYVFALPKSDRERIVPMGEWAAEAIRLHIKKYPPTSCTLPWEKPTHRPQAHKILFRWTTGGHLKSDLFRLLVWKPALVKVGVIPAPTKGPRGRLRYTTTRKEGTHQLRHFYASVTLADGVSIKELAEYLGHKDPGFTLRTYAHMLPNSHQRARNAIDARMKRHLLGSDGAETEQAPS